jgi:phosphatidylserine decarboxylase
MGNKINPKLPLRIIRLDLARFGVHISTLMFIEKVLDILGVQAVFTRHPALSFEGIDTATLVSPCEARLDRAADISPDGSFEEKPSFGRPRRLNLSDLQLPDGVETHFQGGLYIKLYLAPWDRHTVIAPCDCEVIQQHRVEARSLPLVFMPTADLQNKKAGALLRTPAGDYFYLLMIGSFMVDSLAMRLSEGQKLARGERIGEFRLGSSVVLLFPPGKATALCQPVRKVHMGSPLLRWEDCS